MPVFCQNCRYEFEESAVSKHPPHPLCPKCGSTKKDILIQAVDSVVVEDKIHRITIAKEFYEENRITKWKILLVTILAPVLVFFMSGISGVIFGLLVGALTYILSPKAIMKIREKTHYEAQ